MVLAMLTAALPLLPATARAESTSLVINEVDYDQPSTDSAEFVEIKNVSAETIDLSGFSLVFVNGSGGAIYDTIPLTGMLAAGDYHVVCANATTVLNCDLVDDPATNFVQNGAPDAVAIVSGEAVVDAVSYEGDTVAPYTEGSGVGVIDDGAAGQGISRCADGVDTDQNNVDFASNRAITPGAENDCVDEPPPASGLVVNEVDYDQPSTDSAEFVEIKNVSAETIDLSGFSLVFVNGSGGAIYDTIPLAGMLAAGDYHVVCANATTVLNCDLVDGPETNFIQNGAPDAVAITSGGAVVDTVSYEGDTVAPYTEGSGVGVIDDGAAGQGISRCADGVDTDQNNVDFASNRAITPGAENDCVDDPAGDFGACGDAATLIHTIQGSGNASPLAGEIHVAEGVVTGDYQVGGLNGFYVQEEDADVDADPQTSEGIFVFAPGANDVAPGDVVRVQGTVTEFNGLTEIGTVINLAVCSSGNAQPTSTAVTLPVSAITDWEATEGMLITIDQDLFVSGSFTAGRFGEVDLAVGGPLDTPTNVVAPGPPAMALADLNARSRIQLDDGSTAQNPLPLPPYFGPDGTLRIGDSIPDLTGVLSFSFGVYEVLPVGAIEFTRENERPLGAPVVEGSMTIAAFNVLNYFITIDNAGPICGPALNQDCRGADTADELARQRAKIVAALAELDADVVGLIEIENAPDDAPIADLVAGVNDVAGAGTYDYVATGAIGTDAIRQALIYKPANVTPVGAFAILDSSVDPRFVDTLNRPVLAQTFQENGTDDLVTVAINHLKSKGSNCNDVGDPDVGDGQGNCNLTRLAAAEALVDWLATDPTGSGNGQAIIIGDLNSYAMEDPITAVKAAGYTDLIASLEGTGGWEDGAYSFNFNAESGYLDHSLASSELIARVRGIGHWHINADEPTALDYNNFNQPALFQPDEFRSSDHDPIVVGICETTAPVVDVEASRRFILIPNHRYRNVSTEVFVEDADPDATIELVSVTSDEPDDAPGPFDGRTKNDIVIIDDFHFKLRAERHLFGDGRTYTITYRVTDSCGNATEASAEVFVVPLFFFL